MSSRSARKSAAAILDPADDTTTEAVDTTDEQVEPESEALTIEAELAVAHDGSSSEGSATETQSKSATESVDGSIGESSGENTADTRRRSRV